jgi:DNA (cytosine-5)-methyltransferase 1
VNGKLKVLDLFSGIGGFSLGLERTGGFETIAFCEIDPYCRAVLRKHWPDVPIHEDVTKLKASDVGDVDVICGGFPCQDISVAGRGEGLAGSRSGLWSEIRRLARETRARIVVVENASALLGRGLGRVLGDLAALGYDCQWHCIPAGAAGAPHLRDRAWIVAYADESGLETGTHPESRDLCGRNGKTTEEAGQRPLRVLGFVQDGPYGVMANTDSARLERQRKVASGISQELHNARNACRWAAEPDICRVANGVPHRVDRLRALGNAVVPQIPEIIGHAILQAEASHREMNTVGHKE